MKILIDSTIVLDFLLQREPFFQDADRLFQAIGKGQVIGYGTATTLTDIFDISRKHTQSIEKAKQAVSEVLTAIAICPIDRAVVEVAGQSNVADFGDAVQIFSAVFQGLDAIVTRDVIRFEGAPMPVLSIQALMKQVGS